MSINLSQTSEPKMNCIPRSFDIDAIENLYTNPAITKGVMERVFNHFLPRNSDIYITQMIER